MKVRHRSYDLAEQVPSHQSKQEIDGLKKLIWSIRETEPIILQIGADRGTSTLAMLEADNTVRIFSVDNRPCEEEFVNVRRGGFSQAKLVRLLGQSLSIALAWPVDWSFDMLYVDGDHQFDACLADLVYWTRPLKTGGILAVHDYVDDPPDSQQVKDAFDVWWNEYRHEDYELILTADRLKAWKKI